MAFDFFNEGLKPQPKIEFTKQQDDFLVAQLRFLDPKKTQGIPIGSVLPMFQLSQINSTNTKKILQNCKLEGKKTITYEQMKRVFRGIALVQKGIEPSAININANIKLPMPKFYDDDDDEEDEEARPQQKPQPQIKKEKSPPKQIQAVQQPSNKTAVANKDNTFAQFGQFGQFPQKNVPQKQQSQPKAPQPPVQQPKQNIQKQSEPQQTSSPNNKLKQFEAYWSRLNTHNSKIDGGQVKSLCKNLAQRSNLSKAWKICCQTHSGSLTKGEFYVFLEMVGLAQLPQGLTQEMKIIISKIDKQTIKDIPKEKPQAPSIPNQMASTQIFQNFGKSELSMTSVQPSNKPTNQPPFVQKSGQNLAVVTEMSKKLSGKLESQTKLLQCAQQANEQQLLQFRRQQQVMNNMMGQVEQYLLQVNNKNSKIRNQIDELKVNQSNLNERFNKVCMAMNQIINRQNMFIEQLMVEMANQNAANQQKMAVLQAYAIDRNRHCEEIEENYRAHLKKSASNQQQPRSQSIKQKKSITQQNKQPQHLVNPFHQQQPQSPKHQAQVKQKVSSPVIQQQMPTSPRQSPKVEEHHQPQRQSQGQQQGHISQQQLQYMNRMKMKQMQVIQLIHYLTPISPQEYPKIAQKITAYSQEQLNYAYTGLYEKLMQKKKAQQMIAQKQKEKPADQFNSTYFKNGEQENEGQGQDFFS